MWIFLKNSRARAGCRPTRFFETRIRTQRSNYQLFIFHDAWPAYNFTFVTERLVKKPCPLREATFCSRWCRQKSAMSNTRLTNHRVQIPTKEGKYLVEWHEFSRVSGSP
jgi:hypothetical protein